MMSLGSNKGFTLIELLVVVAIIGIIATLGIIAFNGFLLSAKKNVAEANFKTITSYLSTINTKFRFNKSDLVDQENSI